MNKKSNYSEVKKFEDELNACMKCGFCSFWCPVYQAEKTESSVARGKNDLIKSLIAGDLEYSSEYAKKIGKCTLCMRCTENCPARVKTSDIIIAARADSARNHGIAFPNNLIYKYLIPHRKLFGNVVRMASWAQRIFMPKGDGSTRHLPLFLSAIVKGRYIPTIAPRFARQIIPEVNLPAQTGANAPVVGYFTGCMTDFVFPETGKTIIDFLNKNGVKVIVPQEQGCCGAPVFLGAGDFETGRKLADANVKAFADVDIIIADCATCSSTLKEYAKFLADTPERQEQYTAFAGKIMDITQYLVDVLKLPPNAYEVSDEFKGKSITWHDPCHLCRHQGVASQPRDILKSIPDIQYTEMPNANQCCGMAGAFNLYYYELSKTIADRKMEGIDSTEADIVVTGCPGCIYQLRDTVQRHNKSVEVIHIMDLFKNKPVSCE